MRGHVCRRCLRFRPARSHEHLPPSRRARAADSGVTRTPRARSPVWPVRADVGALCLVPRLVQAAAAGACRGRRRARASGGSRMGRMGRMGRGLKGRQSGSTRWTTCRGPRRRSSTPACTSQPPQPNPANAAPRLQRRQPHACIPAVVLRACADGQPTPWHRRAFQKRDNGAGGL